MRSIQLVVVLAAEAQSPLTLDLLRTTLTGRRHGSFSTVIDATSERSARFHPALSGVGWLQPGIEQSGTLTLFPVTTARLPISIRESDTLRIGRVGDP